MAVVLATLMVSLAMAAMALVPRPTTCRGPVARPSPVGSRPNGAPTRDALLRVPAVELRAIDIELVPMTPEHAARCREPVHRALPDGTVEVTFEMCGRDR